MARADHHRAIAIAYARPTRHQDVLVCYVGIRMIGNCGQLIQALSRLLVERLDIFEHVAECYQARANLLGRQAVKHEGIVGIRTVSARNFQRCDDAHGKGMSEKGTLSVTEVPDRRRLSGGVTQCQKLRLQKLEIVFQGGECLPSLRGVTRLGSSFEVLGVRSRLDRIKGGERSLYGMSYSRQTIEIIRRKRFPHLNELPGGFHKEQINELRHQIVIVADLRAKLPNFEERQLGGGVHGRFGARESRRQATYRFEKYRRLK